MTLKPLVSITRRDKLIDELYQLEYFSGDWPEDPDVPPANLELEGERAYSGDTLLVGEAYRPYCFIVDVKIPRSQLQPEQGGTSLDEEVRKVIEKVRAIVELEKPAHTLYYLKLTPVDNAI